jgi:hypothetical protein
MTLKMQALAWDRHTNMAGVNRLILSPSYPLDDWIYISNKTDIKKR